MSICCSLISRYGPIVSLVLIRFYQGGEEKRKRKSKRLKLLEDLKGLDCYPAKPLCTMPGRRICDIFFGVPRLELAP